MCLPATLERVTVRVTRTNLSTAACILWTTPVEMLKKISQRVQAQLEYTLAPKPEDGNPITPLRPKYIEQIVGPADARQPLPSDQAFGRQARWKGICHRVQVLETRMTLDSLDRS